MKDKKVIERINLFLVQNEKQNENKRNKKKKN